MPYAPFVPLRVLSSYSMLEGAIDPKAIAKLAKRAFKVLGMSGFARIDLRMDADGRVYVLEANPNPDIARGEDLAEAASAAGLDYPTLIRRIVSLGMRYRAGWKRLAP